MRNSTAKPPTNNINGQQLTAGTPAPGVDRGDAYEGDGDPGTFDPREFTTATSTTETYARSI